MNLSQLSTPKFHRLIVPSTITHRSSSIVTLASHFPVLYNSKQIRPLRQTQFSTIVFSYQSPSNPNSSQEDDKDDPEAQVQDLQVPENWLLPSKARQESEWLRLTLHKWLDDEYCPEETNVEISKVAAQSYYDSLVEKRTDLGEILLKMVRELQSISYQESFHGAFSSANAAVNLIAQRIELQGPAMGEMLHSHTCASDN
ncbi:uncharacterized protein LOC110612142 isoform X2 [Manihot esculenta]|uniref:Uncharacterized protein n=2 Tax=Manihot esculenta TaxID=3983 RepID=A0ACB7IGW8_MANES|nr:uncharacterized protein LOC110612142 isoform X2 [Manihot esculenta]KAG8663464.1 hypothetical protein MANES_01G213600v8 [Manihot esculenta]KAG8663465.1 hypothetical protein MANES_01G213600v8 [Manihot esculenta]